MKTDISPQGPRAARRIPGTQTGFALVVTLSLMILLTILAVGLLTLSSVSLRVSSQEEAMATARANARMALILALGELQLQTGLDTRVTARADVLDEKSPPILGVWKSWQGKDHASTGRPISPASNYRSTKEKDYFLAWLNSTSIEDPTQLPDGTAGKDTVILVGTGSVGTETVAGRSAANRQVHLTPTPVSAGRLQGKVAWWIGGENQKARLPKPYQLSEDSAAQWATQGKAHSVADPEPFRMDSLLDDATPAPKAITLQQADLIAEKGTSGKASQEFFYDLSAVSTGLLTNTATGGWRKDLSLLSESWTSQPTSGLPLFRVSSDPAVDTSAAFAKTSIRQSGSLFYPWSQYNPWLQQPVQSWDNLMDFVTFYKRGNTDIDNFVTTTSSGTRSAKAWAWVDDATAARYLHKVRLFPVIARIHWVFSHFAEAAGADPSDSTKKLYTPKLLMTPVITMWNPYNLELTLPHELYFELKVIPVALSYQVGSAANNLYNCVLYTNNFTKPTSNIPSLLPYTGGAGQYNTFGFASGLVLKPGETKVYSPASNDRKVPGTGGPWDPVHTLDLIPGYRGSGGHVYPVVNQSGIVTAQPAATSLKAYVSFDTEYYANWGTDGVGTYIEVRTNPSDKYVEWIRTGYSKTVAQKLNPAVGSNNAAAIQQIGTLSQLENNPTPFLSTIFGPRIATSVDDANATQYNPKGFIQSSPFAHFPHFTYKSPTSLPAGYRQYSGTGHPINYGFEYTYALHPAGFDANYPNSGPGDTGYIISGVQSANGVPRCVVAELPSRPLQSLGELVNWDLRFENPSPPFAFNLVGNSDATPLLPQAAVVNSADASIATNCQHDDSYCANHLLFDDWFFSGIAPDPTTFGSSTRDQKTTYSDFVKGTTPLPNRAYQPLLEDRAAATADTAAANQLYTDKVAPAASYRSIASRLEVEGMFNVNSTSVTAWRALLGHARNQKIPYISATNNGWSVELSNETDHVASRFSIAGDTEAGSGGGVFDITQFTGYRKLDDAFLDALAAEVVVQVRKRGPFLSLAEFINRQLSSDGDLAIAGALQAALNTLTASGGATNPVAVIQANSRASVAAVPEGSDPGDKPGYVFPEAAVGYNTYGVPGWTRQADILKPLAPILSARDDTFTIRAYGDARDAQGKVLARSVCEAVVRRTREFVDPADDAAILTAPSKTLNKTFGRRYEIVSFRWLSPNEV
jgi:hypothetical protein